MSETELYLQTETSKFMMSIVLKTKEAQLFTTKVILGSQGAEYNHTLIFL